MAEITWIYVAIFLNRWPVDITATPTTEATAHLYRTDPFGDMKVVFDSPDWIILERPKGDLIQMFIERTLWESLGGTVDES